MKSFDIHLTNVNGLGAKKFVSGLLNHLLVSDSIFVEKVYASPELETTDHPMPSEFIYNRYRMGLFSRILEILLWRYRHNQKNHLLVLGDLPLNTSAKQYVLCHQSLMFKEFRIVSINFIKFLIFRLIFKLFLKKKDIVIVQTQEMARKFKKIFGSKINVEVLDITREYFGWPKFYRTKRFNCRSDSDSITLLYPSAYYPHKNHHLINKINLDETTIVELTINNSELINVSDSVVFLGQMSREEVFQRYKTVDALLFLSSNESLGMPILEAIGCNLPIICPYAEYGKRVQ